MWFLSFINNYSIKPKLNFNNEILTHIKTKKMELAKTKLSFYKNEKSANNLSNDEIKKDGKVSFKSQEKKAIVVKQKRDESFVKASNINFITCQAEVSTIHFLENHTPITVSRTLKSFLEELHEYGFTKSHHNTIVNLLYIHKIQNGVLRQILMKNGETVELSARKLPKIRKMLLLKNNTY